MGEGPATCCRALPVEPPWRFEARSPRRLQSDLAACTANPQKALRSKGFSAWIPGRASGAREPWKSRKSGASHFFDSLGPATCCRAFLMPILPLGARNAGQLPSVYEPAFRKGAGARGAAAFRGQRPGWESDCPWAIRWSRRGMQEGRGGVRGAAAFGGPGRPMAPPACQTKGGPGALGPWPPFQGASRPAAAPGPLGFPPTSKGSKKARLHACRGLAHKTMVGRDTATIPFRRAKPGPALYGPGRHERPAAGRWPRLPAPAGARISPCA